MKASCKTVVPSQSGYWHQKSHNTEHFYHYKNYSCFPLQSPPPHSQTGATIHLFSISIVLSFQGRPMNEIIQSVLFWDWRFSCMSFSGGPSRLLSVSTASFFLLLSCTPCGARTPLEPSVCWTTSVLFPVWAHSEQSCRKHSCTVLCVNSTFSVLWDKRPGVRRLG